ncbi:hypothetical protein GCM10023318_03060 [Nocardia callitridis]|uniref:DUF222 domain-containing protein n=1 Tax=Nocardia callitridis TaxID=648753 RepID=A0ABP9JU24_9NOCA
MGRGVIAAGAIESETATLAATIRASITDYESGADPADRRAAGMRLGPRVLRLTASRISCG